MITNPEYGAIVTFSQLYLKLNNLFTHIQK